MSKVFDSSGFITESIEYDDAEGCVIVGSHQNVAPVLERVQNLNTDGSAGYGESRDIRHKASIPLALYDEWLRHAIRHRVPLYDKQERDKWLRKKLDGHQKLMVAGRDGSRVGFGA